MNRYDYEWNSSASRYLVIDRLRGHERYASDDSKKAIAECHQLDDAELITNTLNRRAEKQIYRG